MKKVNLDTYEAYLVDYLEDNLSADDCRELELFLSEHPEIRSEIGEWLDDHSSFSMYGYNFTTKKSSPFAWLRASYAIAACISVLLIGGSILYFAEHQAEKSPSILADLTSTDGLYSFKDSVADTKSEEVRVYNSDDEHVKLEEIGTQEIMPAEVLPRNTSVENLSTQEIRIAQEMTSENINPDKIITEDISKLEKEKVEEVVVAEIIVADTSVDYLDREKEVLAEAMSEKPIVEDLTAKDIKIDQKPKTSFLSSLQENTRTIIRQVSRGYHARKVQIEKTIIKIDYYFALNTPQK